MGQGEASLASPRLDDKSPTALKVQGRSHTQRARDSHTKHTPARGETPTAPRCERDGDQNSRLLGMQRKPLLGLSCASLCVSNLRRREVLTTHFSTVQEERTTRWEPRHIPTHSRSRPCTYHRRRLLTTQDSTASGSRRCSTMAPSGNISCGVPLLPPRAPGRTAGNHAARTNSQDGASRSRWPLRCSQAGCGGRDRM